MRTIITEGQAIELLHSLFDFEAPVAFDDVKKRFRAESKRLHPDAGGTQEAFVALSTAFDDLKKLYTLGSHLFDAEPLAEDVEGEPRAPAMPRTTVDGISLCELGLGLGPTTNGRECAHCEQRGYTITKEHARGRCEACKGKGYQPQESSCRSCRGTGKFVQRRSGRLVNCRVCKGTGTYRHPFFTQRCTTCGGFGKADTDRVVRILAMKCYECKGTGEIEVWNPVLPKGRLIFTGMTTQSVDAPASPPPQKERGPGKDRLFPEDPDRMNRLLDELKAKGVGGKSSRR